MVGEETRQPRKFSAKRRFKRRRSPETTEIDDALHGEYHWVRGGTDLLVLLRHLKLITDVDGFVNKLDTRNQYNISNVLAKHFLRNYQFVPDAIKRKNKNPIRLEEKEPIRRERETREENEHNAKMSEKILKAMMSASYFGLLLDKKKIIAMVFICSFSFERQSFAYITHNLCQEGYIDKTKLDNFMGECIDRVQVSLEMQGFDIAGVSPEADHLNHYKKPGKIFKKGILSILPNFVATGRLEKESLFRNLRE